MTDYHDADGYWIQTYPGLEIALNLTTQMPGCARICIPLRIHPTLHVCQGVLVILF